MSAKILLLSLFFLVVFMAFSYSVTREHWKQIDFDSTVKLQDYISRRFDAPFSYFSLLGSAEVTVGASLILAFWALIRWRPMAALAWLLILPASLVEVFGKLVLYHPGPPLLFHRSIIATELPSFYIHTDFSYPSGHMTRTVFIVTVIILLLAMKKNFLSKFVVVLLVLLALMMAATRIYLGEHWLSDVLGGALLGISFGLLATALISGKISQLARVRG